MEIPKGSKFIFLVVPVFAICIVVILLLFLGDSQKPLEKTEENIYGTEQEVMDFNELKIETTQEGSGKEAQSGDEVSVHYTGTLRDGTKFDSSYDRGQPFEFTLGQNSVIQGWEQGMLGMRVDEKRKIEIPSVMGYGESGVSSIPGNSGLIFEVELLEIK